MLKRLIHAVAALAFAAPLAVLAQAWPAKPIRIIVPYPPGGPMDPLMRSLQGPLGEALGTQIVVENRPGATAMIGMELVAKAPREG